MTLAEILKAKGVSDETANEILADMKANKIFTAGEENLDVRYGKLKTDHETAAKQLEDANKLIADMKKSTAGNEGLQQKITDYEGKVQTLQAELAQAKLDSAVNIGLLAAGVKPDDVDYVTFKLKQKGELALDESGKIKGWDDKLAALKTQLPAQFESTNSKKYEEFKLDKGDGHDGAVTKEAFAKMGYQDRLKFYNENPTAYAEMTKS